MNGTGITETQYTTLQQAYDFYNIHLFEGTLPGCLITFRGTRKALGYFMPSAFSKREVVAPIEIISIDGIRTIQVTNRETTDEIALNCNHFTGRSDIDILSTLVHEMVHLWQAHFGKPSRGRYHNTEWATGMKRVGLYPSDTGVEGGKETGQNMTHYIMEGGPFQECTKVLLDSEHIKLLWQSGNVSKIDKVKHNKIKYVCPCGVNVWGKPDLNIVCEDCGEPFVGGTNGEDIEGDD